MGVLFDWVWVVAVEEADVDLGVHSTPVLIVKPVAEAVVFLLVISHSIAA